MDDSSISDLDAAYYQNHSKPQYDRAQELLKSLTVTETATVLDVGCGFGNIIAEISKKTPKGHCIGVDASQEMIQLAKESFPASEFPNLEFHQMKAEEMNFKDSFADVIICFSCLLWVREPEKALRLMCKFLKPGGELVILTYLKESAYINFLERTLQNFPTYKSLSAARTMLSIAEYKAILESCSLELEEFRPEWRFSKYENTDALKTYLKGWLNCFVPLPKELQEPFLDKAMLESLAENANPNKNEIALPYQLLAIKAKKRT